jgi:hypothetical protein
MGKEPAQAWGKLTKNSASPLTVEAAHENNVNTHADPAIIFGRRALGKLGTSSFVDRKATAQR